MDINVPIAGAFLLVVLVLFAVAVVVELRAKRRLSHERKRSRIGLFALATGGFLVLCAVRMYSCLRDWPAGRLPFILSSVSLSVCVITFVYVLLRKRLWPEIGPLGLLLAWCTFAGLYLTPTAFWMSALLGFMPFCFVAFCALGGFVALMAWKRWRTMERVLERAWAGVAVGSALSGGLLLAAGWHWVGLNAPFWP
jgi:hypothetical protein